MRGAVLMLALALSACSTQPSRPPATIVQPDDGIPLGTLPRQELEQGQCALFLWKAGNEARLVLMARVDPAVARIALGGRQLDLARTNAPPPQIDDGVGGLFNDAVYSDGATTVALNVVLERRTGLQGGAVVTSGSLRLDQPGGESFVMPAAGLLACR